MWKQYATQLDFDDQVLNYFVNMPEYFVLGKSLVSAPVDADVWAGIGEKPIAFVSMPQYKPDAVSGISLELGGPWAFYKKFYAAHGLTSLETLVQPQSALSSNRELWVPLLLHNHTDAVADVTLHADLPPGWTGNIEDRQYHLDRGSYVSDRDFSQCSRGLQGKSAADVKVDSNTKWGSGRQRRTFCVPGVQRRTSMIAGGH